MSPFFGPEIDKVQNTYKKKGLRRKSSGFSVQKQVKTKKKDLCRKITGFSMQMKLETKQNEKTRSSPQISAALVSHHNMVSPQNGVTWSWPPRPPSYATEKMDAGIKICDRYCGFPCGLSTNYECSVVIEFNTILCTEYTRFLTQSCIELAVYLLSCLRN